jgi:hypothetical protein
VCVCVCVCLSECLFFFDRKTPRAALQLLRRFSNHFSCSVLVLRFPACVCVCVCAHLACAMVNPYVSWCKCGHLRLVSEQQVVLLVNVGATMLVCCVGVGVPRDVCEGA